MIALVGAVLADIVSSAGTLAVGYCRHATTEYCPGGAVGTTYPNCSTPCSLRCLSIDQESGVSKNAVQARQSRASEQKELGFLLAFACSQSIQKRPIAFPSSVVVDVESQESQYALRIRRRCPGQKCRPLKYQLVSPSNPKGLCILNGGSLNGCAFSASTGGGTVQRPPPS
jgi:hypothetical protein